MTNEPSCFEFDEHGAQALALLSSAIATLINDNR